MPSGGALREAAAEPAALFRDPARQRQQREKLAKRRQHQAMARQREREGHRDRAEKRLEQIKALRAKNGARPGLQHVSWR